MDLPREQRPTRPSQSCAARLSRCTHGPGACPRMVHCDSASRGGSQSGAREGTHRVIRQQVICQLSCAQALVKIFCFICEITRLETYEKLRCGEPVGVHGMATIFVTLAFFPESRHESCCRRSLRVWPVVAPCFLPPPRTRGTLSLCAHERVRTGSHRASPAGRRTCGPLHAGARDGPTPPDASPLRNAVDALIANLLAACFRMA